MDLLPTFVGTRPRLACEIRPEGVVVARGESPSGTLTAVARADLRPGLVAPGLKAGNLPDRPAVVAALRRAFDAIAARGADRSRYVTVVVPDAAVRVLLLDFDALPSKPAEALQVVRFRLKKLLPFDVDHALVSFQIMSTERSLLRVLAVAIPQEVLTEYEAAITEAGMQPGVVLPSTLAALAGLSPTTPNALVLNASPAAMTTAIVRSGVLLLHRTIEVYPAESIDTLSAGSPIHPSAVISTEARLTRPLVTPTEARSAQRRDPFSQKGTTASPLPEPNIASPDLISSSFLDLGTSGVETSTPIDLAFVDRADTAAEWSRPDPLENDADLTHPDPESTVVALNTSPDVNNRSRDLAESVSVAAAYFEDTLGTLPDLVLSTGSIPAVDLDRTLAASGLEGLRVRELFDPEALGPGASSAVASTSIASQTLSSRPEPGSPPSELGRSVGERSAVVGPALLATNAPVPHSSQLHREGWDVNRPSPLIPPGWLAGVRGALRS